MTNILVECPELIASVRVGVLDPLRFWVSRGECDVQFRETDRIRKKDIEWCDIFISVRGIGATSEKLVKIAKASGRFCIYFLDDDLADMPPEIPSADFAIKLGAKKHIEETLRHCDVLWTVNAQIAEKYKVWCERTVVGRVPAQVVDFSTEKFCEERVDVLYAGSTDHERMVREQLSPAVRRISEDYPGRFQFTFIGVNPGLGTLDNVRHLPFMDSYEKYRAFVRNGQFCLGLAPIKEGFFYRCKYYNKFIEYASMGIVGIYADQPPYTLVVRDQVNGFLCDTTPDAWYDAILEAASDRQRLEQCAEQAAEQLRSDFSAQAIGELLYSSIPELVSYKAPEGKVHWPMFMPLFSLYYERVRYNFQRYGLAAIGVLAFKAIRKIWKYFRRRKDE